MLVNPYPKTQNCEVANRASWEETARNCTSEVFRFMPLAFPTKLATQTIEFSSSSSSSSESEELLLENSIVFLNSQLLLAPRPRLNLKLASSTALSESSPGRSRR
jgi:hypothetical protein